MNEIDPRRRFSVEAVRKFDPGVEFDVLWGPQSISWIDTPAKTYALWYQRYMYKYGVTNEDLGRYVVLARKHAAWDDSVLDMK